MTWSIPFASTILGWFKTPAPAVVEAPATPLEQPLIRLHRMLLLRCGGNLQLMTTEMNLEKILFQTTSRGLEEGKKLRIDALLQGEGSVIIEGTVEWILQSAVGWRGQLSLSVPEEHRGALSRFLVRQSQSRRG